MTGERLTVMVPLTYAAYQIERRFLRAALRFRFGQRAQMQGDLRYAAIYVIGWGCA